MANDGNTTGSHPIHDSNAARSNPATPSRTPRRVPHRFGTTPPSKPSHEASSATLPSPTPPTTSRIGKHPLSTSGGSTLKHKSVICPICKKDMCHEKALCGHIRWHTHEERQAASVDIARALAASNFVGTRVDQDIEQQGSSKQCKVPDLNEPPPPEDDDGA